MRIQFKQSDRLPCLSWCARLDPDGTVQLRHGNGVETRESGFVEGAWDGDFDAFDFDRAIALCGSGARLRGETLVFVAAFHPLECLYVLRRDAETFVSNSLVFLLAEAGLQLDLTHPGYFYDILRRIRHGIGLPPGRLRMAGGEWVEMYPCANLEWGSGGTLRRVDKPFPPRPDTYDSYFRLLLETTEQVARNAAAPGRKKTYRLVASCSRGYDSPATAAIASLAGCKEGVTFTVSAHPVGNPLTGITEQMCDDSGADSLRALGMSAAEFDKRDFDRLRGYPTAEFFVTYPNAVTDSLMLLWEEHLRGSVFVSGRHGERFWGFRNFCRDEQIREVDDCLLSGHGMLEYRLRAGFLHFPAPYVGAVHARDIHRITMSPEMLPWKLGTSFYNRPIARRIAEEAGIPREYFGQKKMGVGYSRPGLNKESEKSLQEFVRSEVPELIRRHLSTRPLRERRAQQRRLISLRARTHLPLVARLLDLCQTDRLHLTWNSIYLYHFHWGLEKIKDRYTTA